MIRVFFVFGTRPEAIKMAPVILAMRKRPRLVPILCVTSQHREMLQDVLRIFRIEPDHDLQIMNLDQSLFDITRLTLERIERILIAEEPDITLVQGDTTTTFAGALASYYLRIPVGHIEAGLRTDDKYRPFPEEINRRLTTCLADIHFAPTVWAKERLLKENVPAERIAVTGNTVVDALTIVLERTKNDPVLKEGLESRFPFVNDRDKKLILVTAHRRENFGKNLGSICFALREIARRGEKRVEIIFPVHPNPKVREPVREALQDVKTIHLIEPLDYMSFVFLMNRCDLILTDSGGIQEEAPSVGKPVFVMRDKTERPEVLQTGIAKLVGTEPDRIISELISWLESQERPIRESLQPNPFGDGRASERILSIIEEEIRPK